MKTQKIHLKKIYFIVFIIVILNIATINTTASTTKKEFSEHISAKSAVLYEPTRCKFLYQKNADQKLPMASTTKIMTAIVVANECAMDEVVIIGNESGGVEGSSAYLREGDKYTILELLYALMLQSANDAAAALAYYVSGGIDEFANLMNQTAKSLELENTNFTNPHGLDNEDHYTTAKDLAKIGAALLSNETLKNIVSTYSRSFTLEDRTRTYINHNKLLQSYDGCTGVKTGFTKKSGRCLVSSAERDGISLICVTINATSDWSDHKNLLDFGFNSLECIDLCTPGDYLNNIDLLNGEKESVKVSAKEKISIVLEKNNYDIQERIILPRYITAPVNKGDIVGQVIYNIDNEVYTIDITADETVYLNKKKTILNKLTKIFHIQDD